MSSHSTPSPQPIATPDGTSPILAISGFLMVAALFINANPYFGQERLWPWELMGLALASKFVQYEIVLWAAAGLFALVMAFTGAVRLRSTVLVGLTLLFVAQGARNQSGLRITRFEINEIIPMIAMGAGLLLLLRKQLTNTARLLVGLGAVGFLWAYALRFGTDVFAPEIVTIGHDFAAVLDADTVTPTAAMYFWVQLIPKFLLLGAAILAVLVALGLTAKRFLWVVTIFLVVALSAPLVARVVTSLVMDQAETPTMASALFAGMIADGALLWLLGSAALADLTDARGETA